MKFLLISSMLVAAASASSNYYEQCDDLFLAHKAHYGEYKSPKEDSKRNAIFCANMQKADKLNDLQVAAGFGIAFGPSKMADRSDDEFSALLGRKGMGANAGADLSAAKVVAPARRGQRHPMLLKAGQTDATSADWTAAGAVTPVKNQGQCGSCWAHSTTEQIESQWILDGNSMWEFSVQQVNSCTTACRGCGGGDTVAAFEYIMALPSGQGLGSNAFAPYTE